ncbi:MAG TPA: glycosyltransferase [Candidatus Polarisedimenticolia bacterium]|nr:glycosyltransferase [Candidatus Polarisedimenticolia bacterium]
MTEPRERAPVTSRPMSILHVITRLERGGSSDCTLWQAIGAARRGHRVTIACGPTDAASPLLERARRREGIAFVTLPTLGRPVRPAADLRAFLDILGLLRRGRYDVIHLHTSKAGALGRLAAAILGQRRRVVHQPHGHLFYGYYGRLGDALVLFAERLLAPLAARQLALTARGAREHLARGVGREEQFRVIPSGVEMRPLRDAARGRDAARRRLGYGPDDLVVMSLARLEPIKGAPLTLRAFSRAASARPALRLHLAGDGPLLEMLRAEAAALGVAGRARLDGRWGSPEDLLPAADLFVLAPRNEGMGRAVVEALALAVPVIATRVGGLPEVLEEGKSGLLVPPDDETALAEAIARLADDAALRRELGRRGRARSVEFGAGRMVHRVLNLYRELAA